MRQFTGTDRIVVQQRLGSGGFGVVYRGFDRDRNLPIAIKTLREIDPVGLVRFKDEFRSLADIVHPNLVALYELIAHDDHWFFTMELIDGVDFLSYVRGRTRGWRDESSADETTTVAQQAPGGAPDLDRLQNALQQLAAGIDTLHQASKLHRDIKPSNVLVTPAGRVVVLDFGLVRELPKEGDDATVGTGPAVIGTPVYMAPEQATGQPATAASDWYAVGVMLYEALTGQRPFEGTFLELLLAKQGAEPPRPGAVAGGVPEHLDSLCRDLLQPDPRRRPSGGEIRARLGAAAEPRLTTPAPRRAGDFVGRTAELAALDQAYTAMHDGRTVMVSLHGGSGLGKSALLRRFLDEIAARDPSTVVLAGRCYEAESVPYKALDNVLDVLARYLERLPASLVEALLPREVGPLVRLFPALGGLPAVGRSERRHVDVPDSQEVRRRAFGALRELIGRLADRRRLVLMIDDLHWGDADSAALLTEILRPPDPPPLLFVASFRTEEAANAPVLLDLARLQREPAIDAREIRLGELHRDDATALATRLLAASGRSVAPDAAARVAAESGGNPLFIGELTRHLGARPDGERSAAAAGVNLDLDEVIRERVDALPVEAQRLMKLVAIAGQPIETSALARALDSETEDVRTLALLRSARLIRGGGASRWRSVEPYHDRIRVVVASSLSPEEARACHLRIAEALAAAPGPDLERLAIHFERGGRIDQAIPYLIAAADQATAALAFDRAAELYRHAIEVGSPADRHSQRRLERQLATALANAGRGAKAAGVFLAAARDAPPNEAIDLMHQAAQQYLISGHIDKGLDTLKIVLAAVGLKPLGGPRSALLSLLWKHFQFRLRGLTFHERPAAEIPAETLRRIDVCWAISSGLGNVHNLWSHNFHFTGLRLALKAGEPFRAARALSQAIGIVSAGGGPARARAAQIAAVVDPLVARLSDPYLTAMTEVMHGVGAFLMGHWKDALTRLDRGDQLLRDHCTGVSWELNTGHLYAGRSLYWLGELTTLARRLPVLIDEAHERGDLFATTTLRARLAYLVSLTADDPVHARELCRQSIAAWSRRGFSVEHYFEWVGQTDIDLYRGDGPAAWERVTSQWRPLQRTFLTRVQTVRLQSWELRARAALAAAAQLTDRGRRQPLLAIAEQDARRIERERMAWATPLALALHGGVAAARGDDARAAKKLHEAERGFLAGDMTLHAMITRRRLGLLVGGDEGRPLVDEADAWFKSQSVRSPDRFTLMLGG